MLRRGRSLPRGLRPRARRCSAIPARSGANGEPSSGARGAHPRPRRADARDVPARPVPQDLLDRAVPGGYRDRGAAPRDRRAARVSVAHRREGVGHRCTCGAPIQWGSHFCANCGRPVGEAGRLLHRTAGTPFRPTRSSARTAGHAVPAASDDGNGQDDAQTMYQQAEQQAEQCSEAIPGRTRCGAPARAARRTARPTTPPGPRAASAHAAGRRTTRSRSTASSAACGSPSTRGLIPVLATAWRRRSLVPGRLDLARARALVVAALARRDRDPRHGRQRLGDEDRRDPSSVTAETGTGHPSDARDRHLDHRRRPTPTSTRRRNRRRRLRRRPTRLDRVARRPERLDDRALVGPAERGPSSRRQRGAERPLNAGLTDVGILNSSEFSSLHSGYFVVFTGVFNTENEADTRPRHGAGQLPASVRAPDSRVKTPPRKRRGLAQVSTYLSRDFERSRCWCDGQ